MGTAIQIVLLAYVTLVLQQGTSKHFWFREGFVLLPAGHATCQGQDMAGVVGHES